MVAQLHELMEALQACEHCLMGDYASSTQLIPLVVWALILSAQEFYHQVCTCSQLEPAAGTPHTARASLSMYRHMITLRMKLDLNGLPHQWHPQPMQHTSTDQPPNPAKQPAQKSGKPTSDTTPSTLSSNTMATFKTNAQWPHIFTNNDTLKLLCNKKAAL